MAPVVSAIIGNQKRWVDFMMRFELGLEQPDPARAGRSAATIAASYIVGGLIPLAPYIVLQGIRPALWVSVGVTLSALFVFGAIKGHYTGVKPARGGFQTVLVGGLAAAAAFFIARLIS
jgi:VIT1/CCC1 family predicted Fe2+/Mn2+ transporter